VEYSVTSLGYTLRQALAVLYAWTLDHLDVVESARAAFDARGD
jgi:DNA-binding HxlR family transcriptional regulator